MKGKNVFMYIPNHFVKMSPKIDFLLCGWMKEKKFPELFDDSGLDRRKFDQKKNFQEIASF